MTAHLPQQLRSRLTLWYVLVLALILTFYLCLVYVFQYTSIKRQIFHDEVQDVETAEGLLLFNVDGTLELRQNYFSHPRSHLLVDRFMEVRDLSGAVLYRSSTLGTMSLDGPPGPAEGEASFGERETRLADGTRVLLISHTHPVQGRVLLIRVGYSLAPFRERMRQFLGILLFALPASLALAGLAGYKIASHALRPLQEMAVRAETISSSSLHERLYSGNPHDELGHMARVFNNLLERLEEAFLHLQHFTADAAHELRAPLSSIRATCELALRGTPNTAAPEAAMTSILEEVAALNQTIEDLLLLARAEASQPGREHPAFSLKALTTEVLNVLQVLADERNITIQQDTDVGDVHVRADRGLVRSALMNVIHNAIKFSPPHSTVRVDCARTASCFAEVSVRDEGPGISPGEHQQVFRRFYKGVATGTIEYAGTGIGLAIAKLAVEKSGGQIFFDTSFHPGARCVVRLRHHPELLRQPVR